MVEWGAMKYAVRHFHMELSKSLHQHIYLDYVVISQDGTLFFPKQRSILW